MAAPQIETTNQDAFNGFDVAPAITPEPEDFTLDNPASNETDPDSRIFDGSAQLERIRSIARHNRVGPTALLVATLARLSCEIAPRVKVDVGKGPGSLNLFAAIVGPSGSEKSRTLSLAGDVLQVANPSAEYETRTPGSGEGIIAAYAPSVGFSKGEKEPQEIPGAVSVLWQESEVMNLTALKSRKGSTLQGFLTKLFTAEFLNVTNKDGGPTVEDGTYRASLLLGVQPGRADALLSDADQGFPQRFIWTDTLDRSRRRGHEYPEERPVSVRIPDYPNGVIEGCETAKRATYRASDAGLIEGEFNGLDSHAMFARAKVAALLAVLREHDAMTEDDWERARFIMQASERARDMCVNYKHEARKAAKEMQGRELDQEERERVAELQSKIINVLTNEKNNLNAIPRSIISQSMPSQRWRGEILDVALGRLVAAEKVKEEDHPNRKNTLVYRAINKR